MSETSAADDPLADALLAARLFLIAPAALGGMTLRGGGPARDALLAALKSAGLTMRKLPAHVDDERLLGGVDIAASLAAGKAISQAGILTEAACARAALLVPMAERMPDALAGKLSQVFDCAGESAPNGLILLDDGIDPEEAPRLSLTERLAFQVDLSQSQFHGTAILPPASKGIPLSQVDTLSEEALTALTQTAAAFDIHTVRPLLFAQTTARAHASLFGRSEVSEQDLKAAVRLVLAPRALHLPQTSENEPEPPPETPKDQPQNDKSADNSDPGERDLDDILVEAAQAAIPADLLAQLTSGKAKRPAQGSGAGQKRKSALRGKPLGIRPGLPRGGARLALVDSLRAAVPWQPMRRRERVGAGGEDSGAIIMRKGDLRVKRFEERMGKVTIFCVDASGSAAAARLAEAKGAVELMLAQVYVTRSEVALVAFRGESAELLLPPTRSLTRARRALAELPGGGGTPLASGLNIAHELADMIAARGRTPSLVVLTDGRGNIAADGSPGRAQASEDAQAAAKAIHSAGYEGLVIDIAARPGPHAPELAKTMGARFLALPMADAKMLHKAISAATTANAQNTKTAA